MSAELPVAKSRVSPDVFVDRVVLRKNDLGSGVRNQISSGEGLRGTNIPPLSFLKSQSTRTGCSLGEDRLGGKGTAGGVNMFFRL